MRRNKYIFIALIFLVASSCKKSFLDVNNTQSLFRESYVKDLSSMQEYVNGIVVMVSINVEKGDVASYPEIAADNLRPISVTTPPFMKPQYNWTQAADAANGLDYFWRPTYMIIRSCNFVLEDADKYRNENPVKADNIKGQALALRAYAFFKLINMFAQSHNFTADASHPGVPFITTSDITQPYSRQTVAEVYSGMITDLKAALTLLPENIIDVRYMNRNAAKALLARIYLFKEDFANAKALAMEVVNQVPLMTIAAGYPDAVFKFRQPAQTETLFQLAPNFSSYTTLFLSFYSRYTPLKRLAATNDIVQVIREDTTDVRKAWVTDIGGVWNVTKFPIGSAPEITPAIAIPEAAYYPAILRSSEMFLTVAEASARLGDEPTARTYLNAVRKRANPSVTDITASGPALLDSIYKERRKELAFEGLRLYDLLRWKRAVNRADVLPGSPANLPYPSYKAIAPIPTSDVNLAGIPQNPGY